MSFSNSSIGDVLPHLDKTMTQDIINAWADVSSDRNPLHVDPDFAKTTRFGGTIAHGHIALSYMCQLLQNWAGPEWMSGGRLVDIRFISPVRPGQTYRIGGEVSSVSDSEIGIKLSMRELSDNHECIEGVATCPKGGVSHGS